MRWLRLVGSLESWVSFAKEPYKRDDILQKRHIVWKSLLIAATPYLSLSLSFDLSISISLSLVLSCLLSFCFCLVFKVLLEIEYDLVKREKDEASLCWCKWGFPMLMRLPYVAANVYYLSLSLLLNHCLCMSISFYVSLSFPRLSRSFVLNVDRVGAR